MMFSKVGSLLSKFWGFLTRSGSRRRGPRRSGWGSRASAPATTRLPSTESPDTPPSPKPPGEFAGTEETEPGGPTETRPRAVGMSLPDVINNGDSAAKHGAVGTPEVDLLGMGEQPGPDSGPTPHESGDRQPMAADLPEPEAEGEGPPEPDLPASSGSPPLGSPASEHPPEETEVAPLVPGELGGAGETEPDGPTETQPRAVGTSLPDVSKNRDGPATHDAVGRSEGNSLGLKEQPDPDCGSASIESGDRQPMTDDLPDELEQPAPRAGGKAPAEPEPAPSSGPPPSGSSEPGPPPAETEATPPPRVTKPPPYLGPLVEAVFGTDATSQPRVTEPVPVTGRRPTAEGPRTRGEPWRFGARRGKDASAPHGGHQEDGVPPPELRIRLTNGLWEVVLSVASEAGTTEVRQGGESLSDQNREWSVPDFRQDLVVSSDAGKATIPLYSGRKPLLFRLPNNTRQDSGRQCRRITRGKFIALAPDGELRREASAVFRESEPCTDSRFQAHFFVRSEGDTAERVEGFPDWNYSAWDSASLAGTRLYDSSEEDELFVGAPPTLDRTDSIEWARIGEERPGGWPGRNFRVANRTMAEVLGGARGRFFVRTYRPGTTCLDAATSFRYWPDLKEIRIDGRPFCRSLVLIPRSTGHGNTVVRLVDNRGNALRPEVVTPQGLAMKSDGSISVPPRADFDDLRLRLHEDRWQADVAVALPRVWWRLMKMADAPWTDRPISMPRAEFRRSAKCVLQALIPDSIEIVSVGIGREFDQRLRATTGHSAPGKRCWEISLANFVDHAAVRSDGTGPCQVDIRLGAEEVTLLRVTEAPRPRGASVIPVVPPRASRPPLPRTGDPELKDKVVAINRVTKVVKGGKNLSFSALVVVGDEDGRVGFGLGKAREVPAAIKKGIEIAKKNMTTVRREGSTIAHEVVGVFGAGRVMLKPASRGTGVVAGGPVRSVIELAGIKDILTKSIGSSNPKNVIEATMAGLLALRSEEIVAELRGKDVSYVHREVQR